MAVHIEGSDRTRRNRDHGPIRDGAVEPPAGNDEANAKDQGAVTTTRTSCTDGDIPKLTALPGLPRSALTNLWTRLFDRPVPKGLSPQLMVRFLAFEIQARATGGLGPEFAEQLAERAGAAQAVPKVSARLRPGGRLLREWNGVTHVVDVEDGGFFWSGRRYASLSAIAKEITGAHWSGPRFFGLNGGPARDREGSGKPDGTAKSMAGKGVGSGREGTAPKRSLKAPSRIVSNGAPEADALLNGRAGRQSSTPRKSALPSAVHPGRHLRTKSATGRATGGPA